MIRPCLAVMPVALVGIMLGAPIDAYENLKVGLIYIGPVSDCG